MFDFFGPSIVSWNFRLMRRGKLALLIAALAQGSLALAEAPAGQCFWVRGRLGTYNGNPTLRIWPTGTHRLLGVINPRGNDEDPKLPDNLRRLQPSFERDVRGRFYVCPWTKDEPGSMRFVRVERAEDLSVTKIPLIPSR
jgi:hypothetical protein